MYGCQWHLKNTGQLGTVTTSGEDINIEGVWDDGISGAGINVAIVSDGIDLSHEDLSANVRSGLNWNYFEENNSESVDLSDSSSFTGTRAAGVIAATGYNGLGVRGAAHKASIYSYKLAGNFSDADIKDAMVRNKEITAVSVNGWGPEDKYSLHQASAMWEEGLEEGIREGFYGKGVFYVWEAGDGHENNDQANFNGYSNYYGVTAVCSTDGSGKKSISSEEGVNLWVCAPGSDIVTTDNNNGYVVTSGTLLSAAQVSGVVTLMREINGQLSWRDIKLILAGSARQNDVSDISWESGAFKYGSDTEKYKYSSKYGFGTVDAEAAVELARSWKGVGEMRTITASSDNEITIPYGEADGVLTSTLMMPDLEETSFTEFVEAELVFSCGCLQNLNVQITSPSGTVSELVREVAGESVRGSSNEEKNCVSYVRRTHRFGSAKHLGEDPSGEWTLKISDTASGDAEYEENTVTLHSWSIKVYGHKKGNTVQNFGSEITTKAINWGQAEIDDQEYRVGVEITPLVLPAAAGSGTISYSITPTLPDGLSLTRPFFHTITGTPTTPQESITYGWLASDVDGSLALTFSITVKDVPSFGGQTIPDQDYIVGVQIPALFLPRATGGSGTLTYHIIPGLQNGLSFDGITREIAGTPTEASSDTYTYRVTDADGETAELDFKISVRTEAEIPSFGSQTIDDKVYYNGETVTETLLAATGGNGALSYRLTPTGTLPFQLAFITATRTISGTLSLRPEAIPWTRSFKYTVRDADSDTGDGDTDSLTFSITVDDRTPTFGSETVEDQVFVNGSAVTLTLPEATGGDGTLNYSLIGTLADGVDFDENTRTISGTSNLPSNFLPITRTYTYKVTDSDTNNDDADSDSLTFSIKIVEEALSISFSGQGTPLYLYSAGELSSTTMPEATGGTAPYTYNLTPALPSGLSFNENTRVISGTSTTAAPAKTYTYTVTDADGTTKELTFNIATRASFHNITINNKEYTVGTAVTEMLPEAIGDDGAVTVTYSLIPALPNGLSFNGNTREITGTPDTATSIRTYRYTVTTGALYTRNLDFQITVRAAEPDTEPSFGSETIDNQEYIAGSQITPVTLPVATGGNAPLTYSITPSLPSGLGFNENTRVISGTPNTVTSRRTYTYTVTDNNGDTRSLMFRITVRTDGAPTFGSGTIRAQSYVIRSPITPLTLPRATGRNAPLTYSLTPSLPPGLSFNRNTRRISGTPSTVTSRRTYTYTVTDNNGETAELRFTIRVTNPQSPTPPGGTRTSGTDSGGGGGGCAVSDQSSVVPGLLGAVACLMLIPVSVVIRRKRRSQIKT